MSEVTTHEKTDHTIRRESDDSYSSDSAERPINTGLATQLLESLGVQGDADAAQGAFRAAQALVRDAIRERVTDLHLDPETRGLRVRMRIDGVVHDAALLARKQGDRLVNQLKSLAGIDPIAQFDADEARFALRHEDREIDLRLALIPCLEGQKLTLRVLDPRRIVYDLHELGLNDSDLGRIRQWFTGLGGTFVVAGPVGAGKTTTLYSLLHALKLETCSVCTLEDPVEYSVDGINQVQIDTEHGLTFAEGIRAFARHDPDVILVGELRDSTTAQAAYAAAALGRTILTTLHARDAVGAVATLRHYGLADRDIANSLSMIVSQRLVRKLCRHCRRKSTPTDEEKRWFAWIDTPVPEATWDAAGCDHCGHSGYFGQMGVFEVWRLNEEDYHLLIEGATEREIRDRLAARNHNGFLVDALEKAEAGATTVSEVRRLHSTRSALSRPEPIEHQAQ